MKAQDPEISKVAETTLSTADIVDIHAQTLTRVVNKTEDARKMLSVEVRRGQRTIVTHINGVLTQVAARVMSTYGCDVSQERLSKAGSTHGGHPGLRTF